MDKGELAEFVKENDEPPYRSTQLFRGIHERRLTDFKSFSDLPLKFREGLEEIAVLRKLKPDARYLSEDGTRRYLFSTEAGNPVEAVFIPTEKRDTICFSSQSGCALKCDFCLTAKLGFLQNLSAGEIVEQIIYVLNDVYGESQPTPHGTNLVAMGAGEPFQNYENLLKAVWIMNEEDGLFIVPDRITISTVGIVPKIIEFSKLQKRPHLAISLSAPNDELRDKLMPVNTRWNIEELFDAAKVFQNTLRRNERLTFEYVMLKGVNDDVELAQELAGKIKTHDLQRVKINLIPHNPADTLDYSAPDSHTVDAFKRALEKEGISAYIRTPRGDDIFAACGQLAAMGS